LYGLALAHGNFRPQRMEPFFPIFFALFLLYGGACWHVLRAEQGPARTDNRRTLWLIFGLAALFNLILLFSHPTLSDDMFRYIWDGRVQNNGINPYRYASNAPQLFSLRDPAIWASMNRLDAHTIYPPFAQFSFRLLQRLVGDSVFGFKLAFVLMVLAGGLLLARLLAALGQNPLRVIIYLWNPLMIFEIAHAGHVDALYLPLVVGAMCLRAASPPEKVSRRFEAGIGVVLGLAVLSKLYPAFLFAPLWSLRRADGARQWRLTMPIAMLVTIALGYLPYLAPKVDTLGFLAKYGREFFNIGPIIYTYIDATTKLGLPWYRSVTLLMLGLMVIFSLYCWWRPARNSQQAVLRCTYPIAIYLFANMNLFSWYALWLLIPLSLLLKLRPDRRFFQLDFAFAWWIFTGLLAWSYVFFVTGEYQPWSGWVQFYPFYGLLIIALLGRLLPLVKGRTRAQPRP
jgi:hypothetical protein